MQRRPAVGVRAVHVGAAFQQHGDEPLVARRARHAEQVVAVRAAGGDELGEAVDQLRQPVHVLRLDRAVGARERLARVAQPGDVPPQRRPGAEPVLARDDDPRARAGQRRRRSGRRRRPRRRCRPARRPAARRRAPRSSRGPRGRRAGAPVRVRRAARRTPSAAASPETRSSRAITSCASLSLSGSTACGWCERTRATAVSSPARWARTSSLACLRSCSRLGAAGSDADTTASSPHARGPRSPGGKKGPRPTTPHRGGLGPSRGRGAAPAARRGAYQPAGRATR